jgi:hypothetical protein
MGPGSKEDTDMSKNMKGLVLVEGKEGGEQIERRPREAPVTYAGLCSSCAHAPDCTFPRFAGQAVIQCEEWGVEIAPRETAEEQARVEPRAARATPRMVPEPLARGLCATCEEYPTCDYAKSEGGVWHCEEYR